jgi:polysaccharide export outer membrane protein
MALRTLSIVAALTCSLGLAGCGTSRFLSGTGPSTKDIVEAPATHPAAADIRVVDLSVPVVKRVLAAQKISLLSEVFGTAIPPDFAVGAGDALEISVWEAPPAALFGTTSVDVRGLTTASRVSVLPEQMVNNKGEINMPFVGAVRAAGRTTQEIEDDIRRRLQRKANDPQVLVRVLRNVSSMVTVVGEVNASTRVPLTPQGERLLDALAAAGGLRQPVGKLTVRVTRQVVQQGRRVPRAVSLPLDTVITDPAQNIVLQPGDVVTVLHQPNSLTVLGATARNEEINFEAQGITLAQALARAGGLQDQRASPMGVFIFRFEDPAALEEGARERTTVGGLVPVIYRADFKDPTTFFMAQDFPIRNRDIVYVSNAPAAELQKFLNLITSVVMPALTIRNATD